MILSLGVLLSINIFVAGIGPELTTENILQSISAALHLGAVPIIGQHSNKNLVQKNPGVHMDVNQPHIQVSESALLITFSVFL